MRIQVLSDLHNEFKALTAAEAGADVVVLAGDIDLGTRGLLWAREAFPSSPVIYVAGNHEYYRHAFPGLTRKLLAMKHTGSVRFLECGAATIRDVRFLGCTLWSDFGIDGDVEAGMDEALARMNDYDKIRLSPRFRRLRPSDTASRFEASVRWLDDELRHDAERTVVVTHHAPSARSLNPAFASVGVNSAYASDLEDLIARRKPALWIHGHTHFCVDYMLGGTRVVSNQRGYPHIPVKGFDPAMVVEIHPPGGQAPDSNSAEKSVS